MIVYVDTSTLLKLVVEEEGSASAATIWQSAETLVAVCLIIVEARAALAAAARAGRLTPDQHRSAAAVASTLIDAVHLVDVTDVLVDAAAGLAEAEGLRGYDAVHLAASLMVGAPVLTSADAALCAAAGRQGLHVANPLIGAD